ncbi:phage tail tape measure protein [Comamonas nitrativorans]|uniref:Phage tail tape measure protein n=1 Tax=Comamonas nitrativorans TaxID=108437 RepID=A0ABV9GXZ6_9BURK
MADKNLRVSIMLQMAERVLGPLKNISHGSSETAQTLKAAREQLKLLEAAQGDIGSFQRLQQTLGETESKLKSAREHLRATANAFAENDTHKTSATMLSAAQAADKLGAKFNVQQQNLRGLSAKLKEAGISTDNLATDEQQLRARIAATTANIDKQTAALKAQNEIQKQASGIRRAQARNVAARGNARGALLDGVALATTLGAPIKMAMDWEQRLAELNKVADKTPQELAAIANAAQSLAVQTGVAREEIIGAYIAASQAGFAESEWAQFAEVSAKMGVAFDTTGDKAGEMLKAWRSGMSLSMDQAALLAGTVNHIANSMNATATDIGGVLQRQGAYLSAMGLTQTQSAALAATMLSGGATEEIAATASKNFMKAMTVGFAATKSQLKVFEMLNLDPEKLAKQMQQAPEKAIVGVMQRLQKLAPDQLAPAMKMLFGDESIGPAAQIVKSVDGLVAAFAMADDRAKTLGSLQAEFDSMGNTTQQQMHKAREGVKVVTTALGAGLLPAINTTLAAFAPMALGLAQWMQANEGMVTTVVSIIAAIMAFKIAAIAGAYAFTFLKGAWLAGRMGIFMLRTNLPMITAGLNGAKAVALTAGKAVPAALTRMGLAIQAPARGGLGLWQKLRQRMAVPAGQPGRWERLRKTMAAFPDAAKAIGRRMKDAVAALPQTTANAWGRIKDGIAAAGTATGRAYKRLLAYVALQKTAALGAGRRGVVAMALRGPGGLAKDAAGELANLASKGIAGTVTGIAAALLKLRGAIAIVGRALLLNPIGLAVMAIATAALLIVKYWQPIKAFFAGFWQGFSEGLAPLSGMFAGVFGGLGNMLAPLRPAWDWLAGAFAAAWGWVSRLFTPIEHTKESLLGATEAGRGFGAWLAGLVVTVAELVGKFFGWGADIVRGLVSGMLSVVGTVVDTVAGIASKIKGVFTGDMQIKSPSRVFMQYGGFIGQGAAIGMEKILPTVSTAALALAGAAALPMQTHALQAPLIQMAATLPLAQAESSNPAAAATPIAAIAPAAPRAGGASAPPAVGGSTYQITIHAAPGMDGQAIARAVAAELDRRDRAAGARKKSALHDID